MLNSGTEAGRKLWEVSAGHMSGCSPKHCLSARIVEYHDSEGRCGATLAFIETSCVSLKYVSIFTFSSQPHSWLIPYFIYQHISFTTSYLDHDYLP
jgi:hypothetical protein